MGRADDMQMPQCHDMPGQIACTHALLVAAEAATVYLVRAEACKFMPAGADVTFI